MKSVFLLILGAVAIGMAPIFTKLLVVQGHVGPVGAGFWRMSVGALGFLVTMVISRQRRTNSLAVKSLVTNGLKISLLAGLLFALDLTSWHTSFGFTSVASSTLIANLASIFVPICGVLFFGERLRRSLIVGGLCAVTGVVGLTIFKQIGLRDQSHDSLVLGEGLAFLTAFFYTSYMLTVKRLAVKFSSRALMLVSSCVSAVILWIISLLLQQQIIPDQSQAWLWVLGLGLVSQVMGQGLVAKALAYLPVSQSALILLAAPASTAVFGWWILGEALAPMQSASIGITLVGIAIVSLNRRF